MLAPRKSDVGHPEVEYLIEYLHRSTPDSIAMASNLQGIASKLRAMASKLIAMVSILLTRRP